MARGHVIIHISTIWISCYHTQSYTTIAFVCLAWAGERRVLWYTTVYYLKTWCHSGTRMVVYHPSSLLKNWCQSHVSSGWFSHKGRSGAQCSKFLTNDLQGHEASRQLLLCSSSSGETSRAMATASSGVPLRGATWWAWQETATERNMSI